MKILFFSQSRVAAACDRAELPAELPLSHAEFWNALVQAYPQLAAYRKTARLARNETYLRDDELIQPDDEIAIIPPVSGG
jgi:molybdopterin converting factor subunit 1